MKNPYTRYKNLPSGDKFLVWFYGSTLMVGILWVVVLTFGRAR